MLSLKHMAKPIGDDSGSSQKHPYFDGTWLMTATRQVVWLIMKHGHHETGPWEVNVSVIFLIHLHMYTYLYVYISIYIIYRYTYACVRVCVIQPFNCWRGTLNRSSKFPEKASEPRFGIYELLTLVTSQNSLIAIPFCHFQCPHCVWPLLVYIF